MRYRLIAFCLGLLITAVIGLAYWVGLFDSTERIVYDRLFRYSPASARAPDCRQITHVDIDDASLAEVGRWPWPRRRLAELIDELSGLGASAVVLDVIMPEPQSPRPVDDDYLRHPDFVRPQARIGSADAMIRDDDELARAIGGRTPVCLSIYFQVTADEKPDGGPLDERMVRERIAALLSDDPNATAVQAAQAIQPSAAVEAGPVQDQIFNTFRRMRSMLPVRTRFSLAAGAEDGLKLIHAVQAVPPIPPLADAAAGEGYVTFEPDGDGTVRRIPLLMRYQDRVYPQLALLLACRTLGVKLDDIRVQDGGTIVLPGTGGQPTVRIPVDAQGRMLINWRDRNDRWEETFPHLAAHYFLGIARNRRLIAEKEDKLHLAVNLAYGEDSKEAAAYREAFNFLRDPPPELKQLPAEMQKQQLADAQAEVDELERKARADLRVLHDALRAMAPDKLAPDQRERLDILEGMAEPLFEPDKTRAEIAALGQAIEAARARARPLIAGRICFIGSTATGAADFVPTPTVGRCPGVAIHSNILNTILVGRFIRTVPRWLNLLVILGCGALASAISSLVGPRLTTLLVLLTGVALTAANLLVVFSRLSSWMVLASPLAALFLVWGSVAVYRQLTEERRRRFITHALSSYTSPSVAQRVADRPDLLALGGEQREISCFFSDIKGFTPISEALQADRTVALLNRYLDRMTDALLRSEATINKFLGDGIFAFFGAPDTQPDHARRAVLAALACRDALGGLCTELVADGLPSLAMRIGIATGSAVVGNCGSARKFDYTAIGDTVNLASRLEGGNKHFGTSIMVNRAAADAVGGEFLFRPLGRILVVGKQEPVEVLELLDRRASAPEAAVAMAERFAAALEHYRGRRFAEAADAFAAILADRPDDGPARAYLDMTRAAAQTAPGPWWSDVVELTHK
ncbi:MAG: hypothetical protein BIFFINMI_03205 [Phycisphaerae bacterium]|nr:hypothetical protein [Phycisphaerae bacterium]